MHVRYPCKVSSLSVGYLHCMLGICSPCMLSSLSVGYLQFIKPCMPYAFACSCLSWGCCCSLLIRIELLPRLGQLKLVAVPKHMHASVCAHVCVSMCRLFVYAAARPRPLIIPSEVKLRLRLLCFCLAVHRDTIVRAGRGGAVSAERSGKLQLVSSAHTQTHTYTETEGHLWPHYVGVAIIVK